MSERYRGEARHAGESEIEYELRSLCGFLVYMVCDVDPQSEFGHLVHDLDVAEKAMMRESHVGRQGGCR